MDPKEKRLAECQRVIGYFFADPILLETALTHSSLRSPERECNERLEFLGDSVLGLVITEELYHLLPDSAEGEMTRIKSAVVSRKCLFRASTQLGLADFAEYARGVGRRDELPTSVVANLVESVIGAIYLDAGYYPAREFVLRHLGDEIEDVLNDRGAKNYKSLLQHEVQQSTGVTPHYRTVEEEGPDHAKVFIVAAVIQGREWGRASGANKKEAEQDAARLALGAWSRRGRGRRRRKMDDDASPRKGRRRKSVDEPTAASAEPERQGDEPKRTKRAPEKIKSEKKAKKAKKAKQVKRAKQAPQEQAEAPIEPVPSAEAAAPDEDAGPRPALRRARVESEPRPRAKRPAKRPARKRRSTSSEPVETNEAATDPAPTPEIPAEGAPAEGAPAEEAPPAVVKTPPSRKAAGTKRPPRKRRAKRGDAQSAQAASEQPPTEEGPAAVPPSEPSPPSDPKPEPAAKPVAEAKPERKPRPVITPSEAKRPAPPADFGAGILEEAETTAPVPAAANTALTAKPEKASVKVKGRAKAPRQSKPSDDDGFAI